MFDEGFLPLSPLNFFEISIDVHAIDIKKWKEEIEEKKYRLPSTHFLSGEETPFHLSMGWNEEGIAFYFETSEPFEHPSFPSLLDGDSIELFFDTRDVKTGSAITRFCHQFYFLPEAIDGHQKGEITRFRQEETHELANPKDLELFVSKKGSVSKMKGFIKKEALFGYDPAQFGRLGFTYRINRRYGSSIHFAVKTEEFNLDQEPSLWASITLTK